MHIRALHNGAGFQEYGMSKILRYLVFLPALAAMAIAPVQSELPCVPTPQRFLGNSYIPNVAKMKIDIGKGLVMQGRVLSSLDCEPIANAIIEHWQAGDKGIYEDHLRASLLSMPDGSYRFETEWPNLRPPHIHFIVTTDNFKTLETQWRGWQRQKQIDFTMVLEPKE